MRPLMQAFPVNLRRGPLFAFSFFVFGLIAAYKVAGYIISDDVPSLAFVGMAVVGGAFIVAMLNNWRNGLYFFLAWLLFEDFARKFLGNNMAIYFAKDFLLAVVFLSFFVAYRRKDKDLQTFRPPFLVALLIFVWFGAMQMFNPASTSIFYGILGMILYFYYTPLLVVGYALVNSETELRRFFYVNLGLMLVIIALGIVQSIMGHTFLNPEVPAEDIRLLSQTYREAPISGVIVYRPTSVFVSAGRFADLLVVAWLMVFGFSGYLLLRHRRGRVFAFLALVMTAAGCVMCASRGVFMWSLGSGIVGAVAFIWGAPWRQGEVMRIVRTLQRAVFGVALAIVALLLTYPEALLNRSTEVMTMFVEVLRRLRQLAEQAEPDFRSDGFRTLFSMLRRELSEDYFKEVSGHLRQLKFPDVVFVSTRLGAGNKGVGYTLRQLPTDHRFWPLRLFPRRLGGYTLHIHPRDEAGGQAVSALRNRGLALAARALGQSVDHILSFFHMLRAATCPLHWRRQSSGAPFKSWPDNGRSKYSRGWTNAASPVAASTTFAWRSA